MNQRERMRQRVGATANTKKLVRQFARGPGQNIELKIDELIVEEAGTANRYRIAEALKNEVATILQDQGLPPALLKRAHREAVDGGTVVLARNSRDEMIGRQLAQAIYRSLASDRSNARSAATFHNATEAAPKL